MGINVNFDETTGPGIEEDLLLRFLIKRGEQSLSETPPKEQSPWWSFAAAALHFDDNLLERIMQIWDSAARIAVTEGLVLLREAQENLPEQTPLADRREPAEDRDPLDEKDYRKILRYAWKEGRRQLDSGDFQFLPVWCLFGWIGLQGYPAHLKQFEETVQSDLPPERLLEQGHSLIRDGLLGGVAEDTED